MTTEGGTLNLVRNIALGSIYGFVGLFFSLAMLVAILGLGGDGDTNSTSVAEADTGASDAEAEQATENEVSDTDATQAPENEVNATNAEAEPAEEVATDGGTDLAEPAASSNVEAEYSGDLSPEVMQAYLQSEGIDVYVADSNGLVLVDHTSTAQTEEELTGEMGMIGGAYAAMVGDGYPSDGMVVYLYAIDGTYVGSYEADADDARAYASGEIDAEEYALRILDTLQEA